MFAVTMRYELVGNTKRFTIPYNFKEICEKTNTKLFPVCSKKMASYAAEICDYLIITGSPLMVKNKNDLSIKNYDSSEDSLDFALIKAFLKKGKPILGICRGMQIINVYFNGTLKNSIPNHENIRHNIVITSNSNLYKIYQKNNLEVNSSHNQAIDKVAPNFKVTAISNDKIIEAIEYKNIIGIQYHPEKDLDIDFFQKFINILKKGTN